MSSEYQSLKMKIIIKRFKPMIRFYQSVMPMKLNPSMKYNLVPTWEYVLPYMRTNWTRFKYLWYECHLLFHITVNNL